MVEPETIQDLVFGGGKMNIEQAMRIVNPDTIDEEMLNIEFYTEEDGTNTRDNAKKEAFQIALECMEKQIAKKLQIEQIENCSYEYHPFMGYKVICPNCNETFITFIDKQKFCHFCGQRLKWED